MKFNTLSGRFLALMAVFVVIAEILIFVPSVTRFRTDYLQNRLELAQLAALAQLATPPDEQFSEALAAELLATADVFNVVLRRDNVRELVLSDPDMPQVIMPKTDLRPNSDDRDTPYKLMIDALRIYVTPPARVIRVVGQAQFGIGSEVEITLNEEPLRRAMIEHALRILYLSLAITVAVAALLFLAVRYYIVRPMRRVVEHMTAYRDDPEDASRVIAPSSTVRELRDAEMALEDLQRRLTASLRQKDRLAALGSAVAKISHDLRNLLATTQLLADRIDASADPAVRRTAPKLVNSLARAITLCERTLAFGKAEEPPPDLAPVPLAALVNEVIENEAAHIEGPITLASEIPDGVSVRIDADQMFRVFTNLIRNAVQAIRATGQPGSVVVRAEMAPDGLDIRVADTGPGLPAKARENLFKPFQGTARKGGSGLGLAISAELVRGHGGELVLERTGAGGTVFRMRLPCRRS